MLYIITGGVSSGKSQFGEKLLQSFEGKKYYIATMYPDGSKDCEARIYRHRKLRQGKDFVTLEIPYSIYDAMSINSDVKNSNIIIECISNLLANEMYLKKNKAAKCSIVEDIKRLCDICNNVIVITSEVFSDGIEYDEFTKQYIEQMGYINCNLMNMADYGYEVVYSIPICIKEKVEKGI